MVNNKVRWVFRSNQRYKVGDEVLVPVKAKVVSVKDGRIGLEFTAKKIQGLGIGGGKAWALGVKVISNREDLSYEDKNKIIVDETGEIATMVKAKAIGAGGIVTIGDRIILGLPIVQLNPQQMEMFKRLGGESTKIWLNGTSGKIFIT
jgi:hypothetical protein